MIPTRTVISAPLTPRNQSAYCVSTRDVRPVITKKVRNEEVTARQTMTGTSTRRADHGRGTARAVSIGVVDVSVLLMPRCASEG